MSNHSLNTNIENAQLHEVGTEINLEHFISEELIGKRVDQIAASLLADFSREQVKQWVANGDLKLDGKPVKAKVRVKGGETLTLNASVEAHSADLPEKMDLDIVFEDEDVIVVNKPAGLVVHPGAGNWTGTLVNGLLHHDEALASLPRAGLVHRIDKDTSGLLVVAKNSQAQLHLTSQLKDKTVFRHYMALVVGDMVGEIKEGGTVDAPIKRHPMDRKKMSVQDDGKPAVSHFDVEQHFNGYTLVSVQLETGRTHQIRVHMAHIGYPLVGDTTYGGRKQLSAHVKEEIRDAVLGFERQALHAYQLGFEHPRTGKDMLFAAQVPDDMQQLVDTLEEHS